MCGCSADPTPPSGTPDDPGDSAGACRDCAVTSETIATSPADRARTRIGVGEEVRLTTNKGPATWTIAGGGTLTPSSGSHSSVRFKADDTAATVTITAAGSCTCSIALEVVTPSRWIMIQRPGTGLKHTHNRPDCGWYGNLYVEPADVNFYNIEWREVDSKLVATGTPNSYSGWHDAVWHGNYAPNAAGDRVSQWIPLTAHDATGTTGTGRDNIYSGDPGSAATGSAPPFTVGLQHFTIKMQWHLADGTGSVHDFAQQRQEAEIFAPGRCESRKGGNTEHTLWDDATSTR